MKQYERLGHVRDRRRSPELNAWTNMNARCANPKRPDYQFYGGRWVVVCQRWRESFGAFLSDMGLRPDGTSIDRIDNARGYEPGNCRWATKHEQMQNTRATRLIEFNGETMGLNAWAKRIGVHRQSLSDRLRRGWSLEKALTTGATR
jgi:hypothetical protein